MSRPYYWIVNPLLKNHNLPSKITCVNCYCNNKSKKHKIFTILFDKDEKLFYKQFINTKSIN